MFTLVYCVYTSDVLFRCTVCLGIVLEHLPVDCLGISVASPIQASLWLHMCLSIIILVYILWLRVCVCVCACVRACVRACACVRVCVCMCARVCVHAHVCMHVHVSVCVYHVCLYWIILCLVTCWILMELLVLDINFITTA